MPCMAANTISDGVLLSDNASKHALCHACDTLRLHQQYMHRHCKIGTVVGSNPSLLIGSATYLAQALPSETFA